MWLANIRAAIVVLAVSGFCGPVLAQSDAVDTLRATLDRVPARFLISDRGFVELEYGDPQASVRLEEARRSIGDLGNEPPTDIVRGLPRVMALPVLFSSLGGPEDSVTGLVPQDHGPSILLSDAPRQLLILGLQQDAVARVARRALEREGAVQGRRNGAEVIWTPEEDFAIILENVQPESPFGGDLGRTQRFLLRSDHLAYSPAWPAIDAMIEEGPSLADMSSVQAFLAALAQAERGIMRNVQGVLADDASAGQLSQSLAPGVELDIHGVWVAEMGSATTDTGVLFLVLGPGTDVSAISQRLRTNIATGTSLASDRPFADFFQDPPLVTEFDGDYPVVTLSTTSPIDLGSRAASAPANMLYRFAVFQDLSALLAP